MTDKATDETVADMQQPRVQITISTATLFKVAAFIGVGLLLPKVADILVLVFLALVVAAALAPMSTQVQKQFKFPAALAPVVVFLAVFGLIGVVLMSMAPLVALQADQFANALPAMADRARESWAWLSRLGLRFGLSIATDQIISFATERAAIWLKSTAAIAAAVVDGLVTLGVILLGSLFFLIDARVLKNGLLKLFPRDVRPQVEALLEPIAASLGAWVRGVLTNLSVLAGMLAIGWSVAGLPFGLVLGVLAGFADIIPVVGSTTLFLIALGVSFTVSLKMVALTAGVFIVAQLIQNNFVSPIVMARSVEMPPVVLLFALLIGSAILGVKGAIIAVPMAAVVMVLIENLWIPAAEGRSLLLVATAQESGGMDPTDSPPAI